MPFLILACVAVALIALGVFLTAPSMRRRAVRPFLSVPFAHRGLHGDGVAENSLTAFRRAADMGYGMELDVRVSRDGEVVVLHDPTLARVAGDDRAVRDMTAEELSRVSLGGTADGVPRLCDVLKVVDGRTPILIEIKEESASDGDVVTPLLSLLSSYKGPILIESFNPLVLGRVRRRAPHIVRGLLCDRYKDRRGLRYRLLERFLLNFIARPQFIAYCHTAVRFLPFRMLCALYRPSLFAWTVRSPEEERTARAAGFDAVIFEHYRPKDEKETV